MLVAVAEEAEEQSQRINLKSQSKKLRKNNIKLLEILKLSGLLLI